MKKKNFSLFSPHSSGFIASMLFFILYFLTTPHTNVSFADSDFMITVGYFGGIAHPPGYPLYMLLMNWITHLPIPGSIAFRGNLLSVLLHSGTLYFLYLSVWNVIDYLQKKSKFIIISKSIDNTIISFLATASLGFSFLFWTYSLVAEKYALNDLFASIIIYLSILLMTQKNNHRSLWYRLVAISGIALMHHQTIILLAPIVLYLLYQDKKTIKSIFWKLSSIFLTGMTISICLLLVLNAHHALVSWNFPQDIPGLIHELTRRDLTGTTMDGTTRSMYITGVSISQIINKIPTILILYKDFFGLPVLLIMIYGIYKSLKLNKTFAFPLGSLVFFTTIFIPLYVDWTNNIADQAVKVRMHLLGHVATPIFVGIGLYYVLMLFRKTSISKFILLLSSFVILQRLFILFPQVNLKKFDFTHRYYQQILTNTPQNSLLVCMSDVSCFALMYSHLVENIRPDVILLPTVDNSVTSYLAQFPDIHGFNYPSEPDHTLDYISWNLSKRSVAVVDLQKPYYDTAGMDYGIVKYNPSGYFGIISLDQTNEPSPDYVFSQELISSNFAQYDYSRQQLKAAAVQQHILNARAIARQGDISSPAFQQEIVLTKQLANSLPASYQQSVNAFISQLATMKNYMPYGNITNTSSATELVNQADEFMSSQNFNLAFIGYRGSVIQNPRNPEFHNKLAQFYSLIGQTDLAQAEIEYVTRLTDNNF